MEDQRKSVIVSMSSGIVIHNLLRAMATISVRVNLLSEMIIIFYNQSLTSAKSGPHKRISNC